MHARTETHNASWQTIAFDPSCLVKLIAIDLVLTFGISTQSVDVLLEYSMSHVKFVHRTERMPSLDKLCNSFRAAGTNRCLNFSLSLLAIYDSVSWPFRISPGSKELQLAKESVAPWRRSSAGWMLDRT